jgi:hypothetical protein
MFSMTVEKSQNTIIPLPNDIELSNTKLKVNTININMPFKWNDYICIAPLYVIPSLILNVFSPNLTVLGRSVINRKYILI